MNTRNEADQDSALSNEEKRAKHRLQMRFGWDDLIEELIQEGQERGAFENLKGQGRPLDLDRNSYAADWALAHSIMKEHGIVPPWIEKRNRIVAETELMRRELTRQWTRYAQAYAVAQGSNRTALALQWVEVCQEWEVKLAGINKKIDDFNLDRPSDNLELFRLRLDQELLRIGANRDLAVGG